MVMYGFFSSYFHLQGVHLGFSSSEMGLVRFLLAISQSLSGLYLITSTTWMYRTGRVSIPILLGVSALVIFTLGTLPWHFYIGSIFGGTFIGFGVFVMIYYALSDPINSPKYISINEILVGLGSISGNTLSMCNVFIAEPRSYNELYPVGITIFCFVLIFQIYYMKIRKGLPLW